MEKEKKKKWSDKKKDEILGKDIICQGPKSEKKTN